MIRTLIKEINDGVDIRQNLIKLKEFLKDSKNKYAFLYELEHQREFFEKLLKNEDAKIRKNTALIIGLTEKDEFLDILYDAYSREEQRFVRSSYLKAIGGLDYRAIKDKLKVSLDNLKQIETDDDNRKHISEEKKLLSELIISLEGIKKHKFTGYDKKSNLILITNRNFPEVTQRKIVEMEAQKECVMQSKIFNAGVMVLTEDVKSIMQIRTFSELLFILEDVKSCENEPECAALAITQSSLHKFISERHQGSDEYYFRVEYKSKQELDKRSAFAKKFASYVENMSNGNFINSTSNYEIEIRLIENKQGRLNVLIKLFTIKDNRFDYRESTVAASINPVNAALIMELSGQYLKADAKVLDPFCGVGTMLLERNQYMRCNTMYGIDIFGEAVEKAKKNTELSCAIVHYINKNFLDFQHEYLFDEIVTNMPRVTGGRDEKEMNGLYKSFFEKAPQHLFDKGIMVLHTYEPDIVERFMNQNFNRLEKFELSKKEKSYLYLLEKKNN